MEDRARSKAKWNVVALHHAAYSNGDHSEEKTIAALRAQLSALMPQLDIDIVFQGHDHVYVRTDFMRDNNVYKSGMNSVFFNGRDIKTKIDTKDTIYVINGSAGAKHYKAISDDNLLAMFPMPEKVVKTDIPVFSAITVKGDVLSFEAYTVDGSNVKLIDEFALEKHKQTVFLGDADMDGQVDAADARLILRQVARLDKIAGVGIAAADVDRDGAIDAADARLVLRHVAKLQNISPKTILVDPSDYAVGD
ncbi:MAG: dockerin type I domain-containing protein, partial [Oscillospiraceae bacterium]|nr:dockerin type I domain-containing protein [Oscillospiraceae bacterium]